MEDLRARKVSGVKITSVLDIISIERSVRSAAFDGRVDIQHRGQRSVYSGSSAAIHNELRSLLYMSEIGFDDRPRGVRLIGPPRIATASK